MVEFSILLAWRKFLGAWCKWCKSAGSGAWRQLGTMNLSTKTWGHMKRVLNLGHKKYEWTNYCDCLWRQNYFGGVLQISLSIKTHIYHWSNF
jgi:hypothetical protein